ncbi:BnaCnng60090D [Brassica napus]|uniref:BnaCnng60090D protein n=1 Tax=Brassica napus TaxID=3708 RepID=A0A078JSS8_BRANA|nr:BnaCnng60090D [Brassica napus]
MKMRKLCPNLDDEDGLETVLEVPVPEEMNMHALMKAHAVVTAVAADMRTPASSSSMSNVNMHMQSKSDNEFVALLKIVGSPLIPFHVPLEFSCCLPCLALSPSPVALLELPRLDFRVYIVKAI